MRNITSPIFQTTSFKVSELALCVFLLFAGIGILNVDYISSAISKEYVGMTEIVISQTDQGGVFECRLGDVILIRLEENPSTGYQWEVSGIDEQVLKPQDSEYSGAASTALGSGGARTFSFKPQSPGTAKVRMRLRKAWEPEDAAIDHFEVTVHVRGK